MSIHRFIIIWAALACATGIAAYGALPARAPIVSFQADLNKNGQHETYTLDRGTLTVRENDHLIWVSTSSWRITSFALADATNDGVTDVLMSVWKPGNFGASKPFWVQKDDTEIKNHFFIFGFRADHLVPLWQSSNLETPNCSFSIERDPVSGKNELHTIEGDYTDYPECHGYYTARWVWNGWGFTNEWRSERRNF